MESKRLILSSFLLVLLIGLSLGGETNYSNLKSGEEIIVNTSEAVSNAVDLGTGEVDIDALNELLGMPKTQLEQKIDVWNVWFDNNLGWLKFLFRIKPQLSWLFLFNLYFILFFLTHFVLNAKNIWSIFTEEDTHQIIIGASIFLVLLVTNVFLALSKLSLFLIITIWKTLIITNIWISIIAVILFVVLVIIFGMPTVIKLLKLLFGLVNTLFNHSKNKTDKTLKELKEKVEETDAFMAGMKRKGSS